MSDLGLHGPQRGKVNPDQNSAFGPKIAAKILPKLCLQVTRRGKGVLAQPFVVRRSTDSRTGKDVLSEDLKARVY